MNTGDTGLMHQQLLIAINFQDFLDCLEEVNIILTTNSYYDQICRVLFLVLRNSQSDLYFVCKHVIMVNEIERVFFWRMFPL